MGAAALVGLGSCASDHAAPAAPLADASVALAAASTVIADSSPAQRRIEELRARFALGAAVASRFELREGALHAQLPAEAKRVARTASVALPMRAGDPVQLADDTSRVAVTFALHGAGEARVTVASGIALYASALRGADLVHRVHAEGTEDFVVFESKPEIEEIAYEVDVSRVAGLRLVSNTLEFLDDGGAPRLRVAPPYVVGANGVRREARLAVDGCAYDTSGVGPWGRAVTRSGAASCGVRVSWGGAAIVYPAMIDPAWTTTGSMATARQDHTATLLASGKVLVAGGYDGNTILSSAELYDPTGAGSFAATGSMATARQWHAATLLASGKVLVAGGFNGGPYLSTAELYDATGAGTFAATGSMASARRYPTATVLASGKVLVLGGDGLSSAELFDSTGAGSFAATGSMATAHPRHTATLLASGKVLVAGGTPDGTSFLSSAEVFDPTGAGTFTVTGSMAVARTDHTATLLASGKVLVAGGFAGVGSLSSAELFDPTGVGSFAATGVMVAARQSPTATLLASGKVLVAGGKSGSALSSAELYDATGAGTFAATGSMASRREQHSATVLASGKVLMAGGFDGTGYVSSAEVFALVAGGGTCTAAGECVSGVCEDGICCSGACSGTCMTCTAGTGACVAVTAADDPDTCTGTSTCDATGVCKAKNATSCSSATSCASGHCVDGFCCDTACTGQCEACDMPHGTCTAMTGAPHGARSACAGSGTCGTHCDGTTRAACTFPNANTTCGPSCVDGKLATSKCDGMGACVRDESTANACPNNTACTGPTACKPTCANDMDCAAGFTCAANGACASSGSTCIDDHTLKSPTGVVTPCAPFKCAGSACLPQCQSVADCVAPSVCDTNSKCIVPPTAGNGSSGGCSISTEATSRGAPTALLGVALLGALLRSRRRRA